MHPEITSDSPGVCPKCGMKLVREGEEHMHTQEAKGLKESFIELLPLFIIIFGVLVFTFVWSFVFDKRGFSELMQVFMGGFFIIFSGFKLLDVKGFADAYQTYDLLAKRSRLYALSYPFIELLLGIAFLFSFQIRLVSLFTFIIMSFSALGVYTALRTKKRFQCACLGTKLKIPMTKITLAEDLLMSGMALVMIFI